MPTVTPISVAAKADSTGVALTALSAAFFGSLAIYGKFADRMGIPLSELLAARFAVAAFALWVVALLRHERLWWGRRMAGLAVMGLLYVAQAATYFTSLKTVPAAVTSILLYIYPAVVMLLAAAFLGERLTRRRVVALVLAIGGVFAVVDPLNARGATDSAGVLFGLAAAVVYATYILVGRVMLGEVPAVVATAAIATTAGVVFAVAGAVGGQLRPLSGSAYALAGSMAIVATAIPATLLLAGLARVGATRAAILSTLEPVVTVVLAGLLLGEGLGAIRLLGGGVVLLAAILVARSASPGLTEPRVRE